MDTISLQETISLIGRLHNESNRIDSLKRRMLDELFPINCLVQSPAGLGRVLSHGPQFGVLCVDILGDFQRMYRYDQLKPVEK